MNASAPLATAMTHDPSPPRAASATIPPEICCAQDYETLAPQFMAPATHGHVSGGSGCDLTLKANARAFACWQILPRLLSDMRHAHTRTQLAGHALAHPLLLAPVAHQRLVHPLAEAATAQAAEAADAVLVCSTASSLPLETVAQASRARCWFQLYLQPQREVSLHLLRRAEAAGCAALVLTLDAPLQATSHRAQRAGFRWPPDHQAANLACYPVDAPVHAEPGRSAVFHAMRDAPRWADLDWLLAHTRLPVWIKGVLHPDDASALMARGVAGLVVSNHGGRGLDGAPASLQMLPAIRAAVGREAPLILDSGVRSGADVFKALALGANAVMVGRLQVDALAVAGALGVAHMLKLLREELDLCMALAGCATLAEIGPRALCALPSTLAGEMPAC